MLIGPVSGFDSNMPKHFSISNRYVLARADEVIE
jgi:hypothetical protein